MEDAEFPLQPNPRIRLAGELEHERVHAELDLIDLFEREAMLVSQLDAAVNRWMDHDAACKWLVRIVEKLPAASQTFSDRAVVALRREHVREAATSLAAGIGTREVLRRKERRNESIFRRGADMKRLAHRAEHLAQARRLGRCDSECPDK